MGSELHRCRFWFSFAPRARSGRSGCASSAALGRAFACDRAGTDRRADPRCSPPSPETLGRGQRLRPPAWPLGSRTPRRDASCRPRGGSKSPPMDGFTRSDPRAGSPRPPERWPLAPAWRMDYPTPATWRRCTFLIRRATALWLVFSGRPPQPIVSLTQPLSSTPDKGRSLGMTPL